jgi:hypothetical protein
MFTAMQKATEASREVGYRQFVYSKKVADGKMSEAEARKRIAIMQEIANDYLAEAEADAPKFL